MNFIVFYGVLLEFEKRMSVNMQEINSKPWIMGRIMEGANGIFYEVLSYIQVQDLYQKQ